VTIIAYNQTTGSLTLDQLSAPNATLPPTGSGGIILTDFNEIFEIQADDQLRNYVTASFVLLDVGTGLLSVSESLIILDAATGSAFGNNVFNTGSGEGVFRNKSGLNLYFRSLTVAGSSLSILSGSDVITISASAPPGSGEANTASNTGSGEGVFFEKQGVDLVFRSLSGSGAVSVLSASGGTIQISSSAITASQHRRLKQLIHFIDDGPAVGFGSSAYRETTPSGSVFPTNVTWKTSITGSKIVEEIVTYNPNRTIATDQWKIYDSDGMTVLEQITDTISYQGVIELNRTRSISGSL